jgi:hypothetical protein
MIGQNGVSDQKRSSVFWQRHVPFDGLPIGDGRNAYNSMLDSNLVDSFDVDAKRHLPRSSLTAAPPSPFPVPAGSERDSREYMIAQDARKRDPLATLYRAATFSIGSNIISGRAA